MIISLFFNGLLGFGFLVGFLFSTGNIKDALSKFPTDPLIWILYQATQSKACVSALFGLLIVLACCAVMGMVASTSRLTWAFARDNGLPFSTFFAHVSLLSRCNIPMRDKSWLKSLISPLGRPKLSNSHSRHFPKRDSCDANQSY